MTFRRFFLWFCGFIVIFATVNYIIWANWTKVILTKVYDGGDLARMAYQPWSREFRKISNDLPRRHLEMKDFKGQQVDILVVGDSFSNGGGEGRNAYYQDYIASANDCTVLNVYPYPSDDLVMYFQPVTTLAVLYNSGYLDLIHPRCVILQTAERYAIPRFGMPFTFKQTDTLDNLRKYYEGITVNWNYLPKVGFTNMGNFNFLYYNFLYRYSDNAFGHKVYRIPLNRPLFSVKNSSTLLAFDHEVNHIGMTNRDTIKLMNDNLNRLSGILAQKGIKLYFMPIVDKFNLYRDYFVNDRYPRSVFFEELRTLPRAYTLIDTKKILQERVKKGEKDIFHADDTHWTWRASQAVSEQMPVCDCCNKQRPGDRDHH